MRNEEVCDMFEDDGMTDQSSSSEDDEDGQLWNEELEKKFLKVLSRLKKKDSTLYEEDTKYFCNQDVIGSAVQCNQQVESEQMQKLKKWLTGKQSVEDKEVQKEFGALHDFWTNAKQLSEGEKFLRDYILNKKFLDQDKEFNVQKELEKLDAEEKEVRKQSMFEQEYNFRFENQNINLVNENNTGLSKCKNKLKGKKLLTETKKLEVCSPSVENKTTILTNNKNKKRVHELSGDSNQCTSIKSSKISRTTGKLLNGTKALKLYSPCTKKETTTFTCNTNMIRKAQSKANADQSISIKQDVTDMPAQEHFNETKPLEMNSPCIKKETTRSNSNRNKKRIKRLKENTDRSRIIQSRELNSFIADKTKNLKVFNPLIKNKTTFTTNKNMKKSKQLKDSTKKSTNIISSKIKQPPVILNKTRTITAYDSCTKNEITLFTSNKNNRKKQQMIDNAKQSSNIKSNEIDMLSQELLNKTKKLQVYSPCTKKESAPFTSNKTSKRSNELKDNSDQGRLIKSSCLNNALQKLVNKPKKPAVFSPSIKQGKTFTSNKNKKKGQKLNDNANQSTNVKKTVTNWPTHEFLGRIKKHKGSIIGTKKKTILFKENKEKKIKQPIKCNTGKTAGIKTSKIDMHSQALHKRNKKPKVHTICTKKETTPIKSKKMKKRRRRRVVNANQNTAVNSIKIQKLGKNKKLRHRWLKKEIGHRSS